MTAQRFAGSEQNQCRVRQGSVRAQLGTLKRVLIVPVSHAHVLLASGPTVAEVLYRVGRKIMRMCSCARACGEIGLRDGEPRAQLIGRNGGQPVPGTLQISPVDLPGHPEVAAWYVHD